MHPLRGCVWISLMSIRICFILCLLLSVDMHAQNKLPAEAQKVLDGIPGQALTVDFVLQKAMLSSESFREIVSQTILAEVPRLQASSLTDTSLTFGYNRIDDRRQPNSPFGFLRTQQWAYSAQASRNFLTGTNLSLELLHAETQNILPAQFVTAGSSASFTSFDSRATLSISQNLWKDFFGSSLRKQDEAAEEQSVAIRHNVDVSTEEWSLGIIRLYYSAWLAQSQLKQNDAAVLRRERLERIVGLRAQRGTSEAPDVIQVKSSRTNSALQSQSTSQQLHDIWRNLVVSLKFPESFLEVDARLIPLKLDDPVTPALQSCSVKTEDTQSLQVKSAEAAAKSAKLQLEAAQSLARPDLKFVGQLGQNGVDFVDRSKSFDRFRDGTGNMWAAGLQFTMPLGMNAEKARVAQAYADSMKADATLNRTKDDARIAHVNLCQDLERLRQSSTSLQQMVEQQQKRVSLEENRFRLGRIAAFQVMQAEDELMATVIASSSTEIEIRLTAWKLLREKAELKKHLQKLAQPGKG
jgi:outer membrane protein TolC